MTILQTHKETYISSSVAKTKPKIVTYIYMTMSKPSDKSTAPREPSRDGRIIIIIIILIQM